MLRITAFTVLVIVLCVASYITFNAKYIRTGTIVEIRKDAIVVQGGSPYEPAYVLPIEEKSRFYDLKGNETTLSGLKPGDRVKIKLFPRSYGGIFLVREQKTVRWVKVLSEK
jgi:hypothetical protein